MKYLLILSGLFFFAGGCRERIIHCIGIGDQLESWTVYHPGDSLVFHDQLGNESVIKITQVDNKPSYYAKESGGLMKKKAMCTGSVSIFTNTNFFQQTVESVSDESGLERKPTDFNLQINLGDALGYFRIHKASGVFVPEASATGGSIENNYVSGGTTYPEAFVFSTDSSAAGVNVYRFVYARDRGLIEFSTRSPQREWKLQ